ncbi:cupin domain-containing protein [Vagococcus silagei]|uniref:Cupin domain-containing protein n=1 Tax=Vagococcus silagei TaxID=2508885 RepID=A0A4S3B3T9_9ENTE|nr:cupin domain-containing protein [Vagococcus silagei]THB61794.1 cupin domain-containing protein [Vagococcus silagei]
MKNLTMDEIIESLNLVPLVEEGGMVAETYLSEEMYGERHCGSAIYYFLTDKSFSHLHKLSADEVWHFYYGDPVEIIQIDDATGEGGAHKLGVDLANGEKPQVVVKKNVWQGARLIPGGKHGFTLMGTTMSPSFMMEDFVFGPQDEMLKKFPQHETDILKVSGEKIYK